MDQQLGEGRLAAAGFPYQSGQRALRYIQCDTVQNVSLLVGKAHILKTHPMVLSGKGLIGLLKGRRVQHLLQAGDFMIDLRQCGHKAKGSEKGASHPKGHTQNQGQRHQRYPMHLWQLLCLKG